MIALMIVVGDEGNAPEIIRDPRRSTSHCVLADQFLGPIVRFVRELSMYIRAGSGTDAAPSE